MTWNTADLRAEIALEFIEAQEAAVLRIRAIWLAVHSDYVLRKQQAKKRHSLRMLRLRLFRRVAIECKNAKCRVRFVPYRGDTTYCSVACRVRHLALAKYHRDKAPLPTRKCPVCGARFAQRRRDAIYCSRLCNTRAVRRR